MTSSKARRANPYTMDSPRLNIQRLASCPVEGYATPETPHQGAERPKCASRQDEHVVLAHSLDDFPCGLEPRLDHEHIAGLENDRLAAFRR